MCVLLLSLAATAQTVLSGEVTDSSDGEPLPHAIIKVMAGGKVISFATAKSDGKFTLKVNSEAETLTVSAEMMSYTKEEKTISNKSQNLTFKLEISATRLRETVVSAPAIIQRGDTLKFNISAFVGKGDVSLEDALRKVPGITVSNDGTIKYNGKSISNFYVEGLEMMNGNYTLASRNLPAEHVAGVEVLNNHNAAKMDKDRVSDNVALNVKLKDNAKFRPVGTSEAAAGYDGDKFLYTLGATGMMFGKKGQATVSIKAGNIDEFAVNQTTALTVLNRTQSDDIAVSAVGELSGDSPSLSRKRYENIDDRLATANTILKISEEGTVRVNASYAFHKESNAYSSYSEYFLGDDKKMILEESAVAQSRQHLPKVNLDYTLNSAQRYIHNSFYFTGKFMEHGLPSVENGVDIAQKQKIDRFKLGDSFTCRFKTGSLEWSSLTGLEWSKVPTLKLESKSLQDAFNAVQDVTSQIFNVNQTFSTSYTSGRHRLSLPIRLSFLHNSVETNLQRYNQVASINSLKGVNGEVRVSPRYDFTTADKRLDLNATLNFRGVFLNGDNAYDRENQLRFGHFYADPSVGVTLNVSASSRFTLNSSLLHSIGDILCLLTNPVMHDYRSVSVNSGILSQSSNFSARLGYDYQNPFSQWFASLTGQFNLGGMNLLSSKFITDTTSSSSFLLKDNQTKQFTASANISKGLYGSKLSLNASWSWNGRDIVQQNIPVTYSGTVLRIGGNASIKPAGWMEANLSCNWSLTNSKYASVDNSYRRLSAAGKLEFFPLEGLVISSSADFSHYQLSDGSYKDITLLDAAVSYKIKKFTIKFSANNLLNHRHYAYTIYNGLDTQSYDFTIRPREFILSLIFTK